MNGNGLQFATVISLRDRGDILVERVCHGVVVDKYTTFDLKIRRRSAQEWAGWITAAANTPLGTTVSVWDTISDDMMCELEPPTPVDMFTLGARDRGLDRWSYAVLYNGNIFVECGVDFIKAEKLCAALNTYVEFDASNCSQV